VDITTACELGAFTFTNLTAGEYASVTWDFGDGTLSYETGSVNHIFVEEGCYDVTLSLTSSDGCVTSLSKIDMICVLPNPIANIYVPDPIQNYKDNLFYFDNLSSNATTYLWTFGDESSTNMINPIHSYDSPPGFYQITLIAFNEFGCSDTTYTTIQLIEDLSVYVPNSFTPNGDGTNDVFLPIIDSGIDIYTYRLLIFNRWGSVVFESLNKDIGWNGTYGGEIVQDGVYIWKITFNSSDNEEEIEYSGHVTLIK